ncbi:MAG: TonB-dependent receptor [Bacteroidetes bacterium]|nr:TonB-dependent receptor [Bacteroidota bacterium]
MVRFIPVGLNIFSRSNPSAKANSSSCECIFVVKHLTTITTIITGATMKYLFFSLLIILSCSNYLLYSQQLTGTIEGIALDQATRSPLTGANIIIVNTQFGAITDAEGKFIIKNIPVGNYSVQFRMLGYSIITKTDIIVRSQRLTNLSGDLPEQTIESEQVVVTAGYFRQSDVQPLSITALSAEEIRRAPGSGGDISRVIMGLPSLAKVNDQSNSLIVRGGSPLENAFYLDGIEIPNINHFPTQGATGGPIGMVNVDLIDEVNFYTGGFSAAYGDKMSSILDLKLREGNRNNFDGQLDFNIAGIGGVVEGPLGEHGSYVLSLRRSYLEYAIKLFDVGTSVVPWYGDLQGKIVYDLSPEHQLSLITLHSDDHNNPTRPVAEENDMLYYGNQNIYQNAGGIVWRALWNSGFYSVTTAGYQATTANEDFYETNTGAPLLQNRSSEGSIALRNSNHLRISELHAMEFGVDIKQLFVSYNNMFGAYSNALGDTTASATVIKKIDETKLGAFFTYINRPFSGLTAVIGARTDYFSYNNRMTLSPRTSLAYQLNELTSFKLASGMYYQNMPVALLSQSASNSMLRDPYAVHYIFGIDRLLNEDTKLSVEVYQKEYYDFLVDPSDPALFLVDEIFYRNGLYFNHALFTNNGSARSRGIELTLQKKLAQDFYGIASATLFRTEYKGADNVWRNRIFDNRLIVSVEGGYKPNAEWEFSARWIYAGGTPYTPFDLPQSAQRKRGVFDRTKINAARYPAYHSMNVRVDKRFHFTHSNLILYLSAWNVYNRKNVAAYFWNEKENKEDTIYQWNLLPLFGVEYEL